MNVSAEKSSICKFCTVCVFKVKFSNCECCCFCCQKTYFDVGQGKWDYGGLSTHKPREQFDAKLTQ